jgi:dephospho-CoA kinase
MFRSLGAYTLSSDEIVHRLLSPSTTVGKEVIDLLGSDIVENGSIQRHKIAKKVFSNKVLLKALESLLHPAVYHAIECQYQDLLKQGGTGLFVVEVPLLFETGGEDKFDDTISVTADFNLCVRRFTASTGCLEDEYRRRASLQLSTDEKAAKADFVIVNNGDEDELRQQVENIFNHLLAR